MASTVTQHYIIDMSSNNNFVQVPAVQGDGNNARYIEIELISNGVPYTIDTSTYDITIAGTKPDGTSFWNNCTVQSGYIMVQLTYQMTAAAGRVDCQIMFINKNRNDQIKSFPFYIIVTQAAIDPDKILSSNEFENLVEITDAAQRALDQIEVIEEEIVGFNEDSEAYAIGKRGGVDVPSSDPAYHNNSKYYSQQASTKATQAANSATTAATQASNAASSATSAAASADRAASWSAHPPYIGANGNWWIYNTTSNTYVDSGIDASITLQIADITMLDPADLPYVTNTGTDTDAVFHFFIPRGMGIQRIRKTGTSGLVDTYTIYYSDGSTTTFTVTNGKSAYQSAVDGGYTKSEQEFYNELASFGGWYEDSVQAASEAGDYRTEARSWAEGGTGTRPGEDTDNAEYWARQAASATGLVFDDVPTKNSLNPVRSSGIYDAIGKRLTGTITGNTLIMTDPEIGFDSVIEGPYVDGKYMRIANFTQSSEHTIVFTFEDLTGDGLDAIAWIRI